MAAVHITSFGFLHAPAPVADVTIDVRTVLRDPHVDPTVRELTGHDSAVRRRVVSTRAAYRLVVHTVDLVAELAGCASPVAVAIGCAGGRHRSVALAELIRDALVSLGVDAVAAHRDVEKPVVSRASSARIDLT